MFPNMETISIRKSFFIAVRRIFLWPVTVGACGVAGGGK